MQNTQYPPNMQDTNQQEFQKPPKKRNILGMGCLISLAILIGFGFVGCAILGGAAVVFEDAFSDDEEDVFSGFAYTEHIVEEGSGDEKILILDIEGVISSEGGAEGSMLAHVRAQLREVRSNSDFVGVLLRVNSPGGGVTASDQIYEEVMKTKAAGKTIFVFMDEVAASGGYYISCGADKIMATPTTITGSIGVIISSINATELMDKIGIKPQVFTSGEYKDTLSISRDMRPDEQSYIQAMVEESFDRFVSLVSEGRGLSRADLEKRKLIDGRILSGASAYQLGLVDQVGYWDDAVANVRELSGAPNAELVRMEVEVDFLDVVSMFGVKASEPAVTVEISPNFAMPLKPNVPYALPIEYVK